MGMGSLSDLFSNDAVGATGKWIVEQLHRQYPDAEIEAEIEYDDGMSDTYVEYVSLKNGNVVSCWEVQEDDDDEEDEEDE